jgi:hypothetical protein
MISLKKVFVTLCLIIGSISLIATYLNVTGKDQKLLLTVLSFYMKPDGVFDAKKMSAAPNYAVDNNWASLPARKDEADLLPQGVISSINDGTAPVDVFYIHGTGYVGNASWTWSMVNSSATRENARFSLANEVSIFNGCCNIYAPHYREASIYAYIGMPAVKWQQFLDVIYPDISNAFQYFLQHHNRSKPIVIVSHSQGTHLALKLLKEIDASTEVAEQVVAAYTIGSGSISLNQDFVDSLKHFSTCGKATDIGCIVHWDTYGENGKEKIFNSPEQSICINPLSWADDEKVASAELNLGSMPVSGTYSFRLDDKLINKGTYKEKQNPMSNYTGAQCRDGYLYVDDQTGTKYAELGEMPSHNLHGINFPLFHMNIRHNVQVRIGEYFRLYNQQMTR